MATFNQSTESSGRDTIERAGTATANAGYEAADAVKDASRKASAAVDHASEIAQQKLDTMADYVRRNPLQSTAIAAGIGFVFALIARR